MVSRKPHHLSAKRVTVVVETYGARRSALPEVRRPPAAWYRYVARVKPGDRIEQCTGVQARKTGRSAGPSRHQLYPGAKPSALRPANYSASVSWQAAFGPEVRRMSNRRLGGHSSDFHGPAARSRAISERAEPGAADGGARKLSRLHCSGLPRLVCWSFGGDGEEAMPQVLSSRAGWGRSFFERVTDGKGEVGLS